MILHLKEYMEYWRKKVDKALDHYLPASNTPPGTIHKAMRYSVFAGGKRLRPILAIASSEACGLNGKRVLPCACALELIHTYSLIHDDLPAMDDDDLRRGKPTSHKVFGEGMAVLAGDALLTLSFKLAAENAKIINSSFRTVRLIETISDAAGTTGMVGGQVLDLEMDGGRWKKKNKGDQGKILDNIHLWKTSAMMQSSLVCGALLAGADDHEIRNLSQYGLKMGLAFQVADDILDIVGDKKLLGKRGSDLSNEKLTYPAVYGLEESRKEALRLVRDSKKHLETFGKKAMVLRDLADFVVERTF